MKNSKESLIVDYINKQDENKRPRLLELHNLIMKSVPKAEEAIKWDMPTYVLNGNIAHFAAQKNHIGFHPGKRVIDKYSDEIARYLGSKTTLHFSYEEDLPEELIKKILVCQVE